MELSPDGMADFYDSEDEEVELQQADHEQAEPYSVPFPNPLEEGADRFSGHVFSGYSPRPGSIGVSPMTRLKQGMRADVATKKTQQVVMLPSAAVMPLCLVRSATPAVRTFSHSKRHCSLDWQPSPRLA